MVTNRDGDRVVAQDDTLRLLLAQIRENKEDAARDRARTNEVKKSSLLEYSASLVENILQRGPKLGMWKLSMMHTVKNTEGIVTFRACPVWLRTLAHPLSRFHCMNINLTMISIPSLPRK